MNIKNLNLEPLTVEELYETQGGGLTDYITAGLALASGIYLAGYATGKAIYHATH